MSKISNSLFRSNCRLMSTVLVGHQEPKWCRYWSSKLSVFISIISKNKLMMVNCRFLFHSQNASIKPLWLNSPSRASRSRRRSQNIRWEDEDVLNYKFKVVLFACKPADPRLCLYKYHDSTVSVRHVKYGVERTGTDWLLRSDVDRPWLLYLSPSERRVYCY